MSDYDQTAHPDADDDDGGALTLTQLRKQFTDFASVKMREIDEARQSWRYYHGVQYTEDEVKTLRKRGQPVITFNRVGRKVNGLVGVVQKLRNDPKAFPRTQAHETGADLATAVLRSVLDASRWVDIDRQCTLDAAIHGLAVCELQLLGGREADPDIGVSRVDPVTYFYDPRSVRDDFSDARYDGVSRWVSEDEIEEMFPGKAEDIVGGSEQTTQFDADREYLWVNERKKIRLVEHWYKHQGAWKWCIYANWTVLDRGDSPFVDEHDRPRSRYLKWANAVDQDGDRYGFVRNLKGPQDAINQHRSKSMHIMNTRQIWARRGVFQDMETARREAARPDGVLIFDGTREDFSIESGDNEFVKQTEYFKQALEEIENFGPSPALVGTGVDAKSGRALAIMQQNGVAELGPFLGNYRRWKLEVYRSVWQAARMHWQAERYIRVTDDQEAAQFIQVNAMRVGPNGMPQLINALGMLDVDIIMDEGPDTTNVMGDVYDTLQSLAQSKFPIPPQAIIEVAALPRAQKEKILAALNQPPDPMQQQAKQFELAHAQAKVADTQAAAQKKQAETARTMTETRLAPFSLAHDMQRDIRDTALRVNDQLHGIHMDAAGHELALRQQHAAAQQAHAPQE